MKLKGEMLKLIHKEKLIGIIENPMPDELAMVGEISLCAEAKHYSDLFSFFRDNERKWSEEPPFSEDLLSDWFVEDENGNRSKTDVPVITEDNQIWWR